jgi:hypothetical protein
MGCQAVILSLRLAPLRFGENITVPGAIAVVSLVVDGILFVELSNPSPLIFEATINGARFT